jgi:hypothetical protein
MSTGPSNLRYLFRGPLPVCVCMCVCVVSVLLHFAALPACFNFFLKKQLFPRPALREKELKNTPKLFGCVFRLFFLCVPTVGKTDAEIQTATVSAAKAGEYLQHTHTHTHTHLKLSAEVGSAARLPNSCCALGARTRVPLCV